MPLLLIRAFQNRHTGEVYNLVGDRYEIKRQKEAAVVHSSFTFDQAMMNRHLEIISVKLLFDPNIKHHG
jgi:hypothetical protein